jgi:hypothetical protein
MATRTETDELTLEEFVRNAKNGVLDDHVEAFMPAGKYGPKSTASREAIRRIGTARATRNSRKAPTPTSVERRTKVMDASKPG